MSMDIYDNGTPKYLTAQSIYEGLQTLVNVAEEMGILGEMFPDVSYEGSDYYYIDTGGKLLEKFDAAFERGNKMWLADLALWQLAFDEDRLSCYEVHDFVYEALIDLDLAKRIDFKKLFIEHMLFGDKRHYEEITEAFHEELHELNRFGKVEMIQAYDRVQKERNEYRGVTPYPNFSGALFKKMRGLNLQKECVLLAECRSLLTAYDDFNHGIHMNHELYKGLEQQYQAKMAALQAGYDGMVARLLALAESQGVTLCDVEDSKMLIGSTKEDAI